MPKILGTRKQKAAVLLKRLQNGPTFSGFGFTGVTVEQAIEEASAQFRRWSASWVLEDLKALIPELRREP